MQEALNALSLLDKAESILGGSMSDEQRHKFDDYRIRIAGFGLLAIRDYLEPKEGKEGLKTL